MIRVTPRPGEHMSITIKRFRKICEREGVIKEVKKHTYFESKSQIQRRKKLKAIRRFKAENADNPQFGTSQGSSPKKLAKKRR